MLELKLGCLLLTQLVLQVRVLELQLLDEFRLTVVLLSEQHQRILGLVQS